ncbi:MAG: hypothetical protein QW666_03515 [Candidatus Woesearchaeota archaeon]
MLGAGRKYRPGDIYTVFAPADESEITEKEFKAIYENIIKNVDIKSEQKGPKRIYKIEFRFNPDAYRGYKFKNSTCIDYDKPKPVKLVCGDMNIIFPEDIQKVCGRYLLSEKEVRDILSYYTASLLLNSTYKIRDIWIIGHSDLRSKWDK